MASLVSFPPLSSPPSVPSLSLPSLSLSFHTHFFVLVFQRGALLGFLWALARHHVEARDFSQYIVYVHHTNGGKACVLTSRSSQIYNIIFMDRDDLHPRHFLDPSGYLARLASILDDGEYTSSRLVSEGGSTIVFCLHAVSHYCCDQGAQRTSLGVDELHSPVVVHRLIGTLNRSHGTPNVDQGQVAHSNHAKSGQNGPKDLGYIVRCGGFMSREDLGADY